MEQDAFEAMKSGLRSGYTEERQDYRQQLGPLIARLSVVVPIIARYSILGGIVYLSWMAYENRYILLFAGVAVFWVNRGHLQNRIFGGLLGSASFMTVARMKANGYFDGRGLILGRARDMKPSRMSAFRELIRSPLLESEGVVRQFLHAMTGGRIDLMRVRDQPLVRLPKYIHSILVGPAGSGKNISYVFPITLSYEHSMVILDPKSGENFKVTSEARRSMGQRVIRLDPFGVHGPGGQNINILDLFDPDSPWLVSEARQVAADLAPKTGREKEDHWINLSQKLLTFLILVVVTGAPAGMKNLNMVRYLASDLTRLKACFTEVKKSRKITGILADMAAELDSISDREFSSVMSTTGQAITFLQDPLVAAHVESSSFDIRSATTDTTTYLILPAKLMNSYASLMRYWLNSFILAKKDEGLDESRELMFMLDEVGNLGPLTCLKEAVTVGRGMGIRCFYILQAWDQLEACFPGPDAKTIQAGADLKLFLAVNDLATAKIVSEMAGTATVTVTSVSDGRNRNSGGFSSPSSSGSNQGKSCSPQARKLLMEDEVLRSPETAYAFITGQPPLVLSPMKHYEDREFSHLNSGALRLTPSIFSWAFALAGLYFALGSAWGNMPTATRRFDDPSPVYSESAAVASGATRDVNMERLLEGMTSQPAPAAPQWPAEAICPRCKSVFSLPDGYDGRLLKCEDCPTEFLVHKQ